MNWESLAQEKYDAILLKIPPFLRGVASAKVSQKAESLALAQGSGKVSLKDVVDAFFIETPFGFHGPLKMDMEALGIDYQQYGHSD